MAESLTVKWAALVATLSVPDRVRRVRELADAAIDAHQIADAALCELAAHASYLAEEVARLTAAPPPEGPT